MNCLSKTKVDRYSPKVGEVKMSNCVSKLLQGSIGLKLKYSVNKIIVKNDSYNFKMLLTVISHNKK